MARRLLLIAAWVAATFATGMVAWGAVSMAQNRVVDAPVRPVSAAELATIATDAAEVVGTTPATQATAPAAAPSTAAPTVPGTAPATTVPATTAPAQPTTSAPASSATTSPTATSSTTSTSTTSTTVAEDLVKSAYSMIGGRVVIESRRGEVWLFSLTPNPGFSSDVEKQGPDKVELVFKSEGHESHFEARWDGDELDVSIDEDGDD